MFEPENNQIMNKLQKTNIYPSNLLQSEKNNVNKDINIIKSQQGL